MTTLVILLVVVTIVDIWMYFDIKKQQRKHEDEILDLQNFIDELTEAKLEADLDLAYVSKWIQLQDEGMDEVVAKINELPDEIAEHILGKKDVSEDAS